MTILAQPVLLRLEAQEIVAQAETAVHRLERCGACEGQQLMATQILAALRHLDRIIEHHHGHLAHAAPAATAHRPAARRCAWWIGALWIARRGAEERAPAVPQTFGGSLSGGLGAGLRSGAG